jgi:hypothetical protein
MSGVNIYKPARRVAAQRFASIGAARGWREGGGRSTSAPKAKLVWKIYLNLTRNGKFDAFGGGEASAKGSFIVQ